MRLLLVNLPKSYSGKVGEPFGIEMLVASLKGKHKVDVLDAQLHSASPREFARMAARYKPEPDACGISAQPSSQNELKEAVEAIRAEHGNGKLIMVGGHMTSVGRRAILEANPGIDVTVLGRGELAADAVLSAYEQGRGYGGIPNTIWRSGSEILENRREPVGISSLPWADRSLFEQYSELGLIPKNKLMMYKSGGCVGVCPFCAVHSFFPRSNSGGMKGSSWISRAPEDVAGEMLSLHSSYYKRSESPRLIFDFVDTDAFGLDPGGWRELSRIIAKAGVQSQMESWISTRLDEFVENEETVRLMSGAGLRGAFLGLESSNPRDIRLYMKNSTILEPRRISAEEYSGLACKAKRLCDELGIRLKFGWVNVHADTKLQDILSSINFLKANGLLYSVSAIVKQIAVYSGTAIERQYSRRGILRDAGDSADWLDRKHAYTIIDPLAATFMSYFKEFKRAVLAIKDEFLVNTRFVNFEDEDAKLESSYFKRLRDIEYEFSSALAKQVFGASKAAELAETVGRFAAAYRNVFREYGKERGIQ